MADPSIPIDAELLDIAGRSLKVVANFAVGHDNIDVEAARERGVRATNTPDVLTNATAELALALMLAAARRIAEADALTRSGRWPPEDQILGRELAGATVGLVGFGRIARRVMELLRCFDVRLLFTSRSEAPARHGAERRDLGELLADSDFVSLHVPLTTETRHLIDATRLAQVKPGAILVNTSRGAVVDTPALVDALRSGHAGRGRPRCLRGRAARASEPARAAEHGPAAPPRLGDGRNEGRDGAPMRRERDRRHRGARATGAGGLAGSPVPDASSDWYRASSSSSLSLDGKRKKISAAPSRIATIPAM